MSSSSRSFRFVGRMALTVLALALFCIACGKDKPLKMNPDYSINVIRVPEEWPREKVDWPKDETKRNLWQEAYAKYGRPDFIRKVYTFDNRIIRPAEITEGVVMSNRRPVPVDEWIYIDRDEAVLFSSNSYEVIEIADQVRTVAMYGDPNDIKSFPIDGIDRTSFYYFNHGKEFVFVDGVLTETKPLGTAMPRHTKIR